MAANYQLVISFGTIPRSWCFSRFKLGNAKSTRAHTGTIWQQELFLTRCSLLPSARAAALSLGRLKPRLFSKVLLVCRRLPPMYERDMLVRWSMLYHVERWLLYRITEGLMLYYTVSFRKQFEEFGAVEAVEWWSVRGRKSSRLVISFKVPNCSQSWFVEIEYFQDKGVALDLIGSIQVVFGEKVKVREVSAFTMID